MNSFRTLSAALYAMAIAITAYSTPAGPAVPSEQAKSKQAEIDLESFRSIRGDATSVDVVRQPENDYPTIDKVQENRKRAPVGLRKGKLLHSRANLNNRYAERTQSAVARGLHSVPGHYIVSFTQGSFPYSETEGGSVFWMDKNGATLDERAQQLADALGGTEVITTIRLGSGAVSIYMTPEQRRKVASLPYVSDVQEDKIYHTNGYLLTGTWGADTIDNRRMQISNSSNWTATGAGVHVFIVDTGVQATHDQFQTPQNRIGDGYCSINGVELNTAYAPVQFHGTFVAGIALGAYTGVAPSAILHSVRITENASSITSTDVAKGLVWILERVNGATGLPVLRPAIVNMSLGWSGGVLDPIMDLAVNSVLEAGVTVVVAAGNDNTIVASSPAYNPKVITVGAVAFDKKRLNITYPNGTINKSNYGPRVDIWAPGVAVQSSAMSASSNSSYGTSDGTSFAAPHVAGVAALYLQRHPLATPDEVRNTIVANASRNILNVGALADGGIGVAEGSPNRFLYMGDEWNEPDRLILDNPDPNDLSSAPFGGRIVAGVLNITNPDGKVYDQTLMTTRVCRLHADPGQIARVSWIDPNNDIVMAELSGCGNLKVTLTLTDPNANAAPPVNYNQPTISYLKGLASLELEGPSENTWLSVRTVGPANASPVLCNHPVTDYDSKADIAAISFWKAKERDSGNITTIYQGKTLNYSLRDDRLSLGGILGGNCVFTDRPEHQISHNKINTSYTGIIGIKLDGVDVKYRLHLRDIEANNATSTPYLLIGARSVLLETSREVAFFPNSTTPRFPNTIAPAVAGGDLVQPNGTTVLTTSTDPLCLGRGFDRLLTDANCDAAGRYVPPLPLDQAYVGVLPYACGNSAMYPAIPDGVTH